MIITFDIKILYEKEDDRRCYCSAGFFQESNMMIYRERPTATSFLDLVSSRFKKQSTGKANKTKINALEFFLHLTYFVKSASKSIC